MSDHSHPLASQIAALEAVLLLPLPADTRAQIEQDLRTLRAHGSASTRAVGDANVSGTLYGNAVGANYGTVQAYIGAAPAVPADQPAAGSPKAIDDQRELLTAHRHTLALYLRQLALLGSAYIPPGVESGIHEARAAIQRAKKTLRGWGAAVDDHPDDER
jgi:hypothetical protein